MNCIKMQDGFLWFILTKLLPWDLHWPGLYQLHQLNCTVGGRVKLPELGRNAKGECLLHTATRGHKKQS